MKKLLMSAILLAVSAQLAVAGPYFRWEPLSEVKTGMFFELNASYEESRIGAIVPLVRHHSEDGHLFLRGVDWDLLNVGWSKATDSSRHLYTFGPSLHLEEPVKTVLRKGVRYLPGGKDADNYAALRYILSPKEAGSKAVYFALGPNLGLQQPTTFSDWGKWKGVFLLSATLNKPF